MPTRFEASAGRGMYLIAVAMYGTFTRTSYAMEAKCAKQQCVEPNSTIDMDKVGEQFEKEPEDGPLLLQLPLEASAGPSLENIVENKPHEELSDPLNFVLANGSAFGRTSTRTTGQSPHEVEYIAMAPTKGKFPFKSDKWEWLKLEYPTGVSNTSDVKMSRVSSPPPEIGDSWFNIDTATSLTAKVHGSSIVSLAATHETSQGCCAEFLVFFDKDANDTLGRWIPLDPIMEKLFVSSKFAHATHTLDISTFEGGRLGALLTAGFFDSRLGTVASALVVLDLTDFSVIPTAKGDGYFDIFQEHGTFSLAPEDSILKIQYFVEKNLEKYTKYRPDDYGGLALFYEQYHVNGIQRFTSIAGTKLIATTHRYSNEAIIFTDPWTYQTTRIVQRFGTPYIVSYPFDIQFPAPLHVPARHAMGYASPKQIRMPNGTHFPTHYFGVKSTHGPFYGVHNIYYSPVSEALGGKESFTMFVNTWNNGSHAIEFELRDVQQGSGDDHGGESVFDTNYVYASCRHNAWGVGGAKPIGKGVYAVMDGSGHALEITDVTGGHQALKYSLGDTGNVGMYDPFIAIRSPSTFDVSLKGHGMRLTALLALLASSVLHLTE